MTKVKTVTVDQYNELLGLYNALEERLTDVEMKVNAESMILGEDEDDGMTSNYTDADLKAMNNVIPGSDSDEPIPTKNEMIHQIIDEMKSEQRQGLLKADRVLKAVPKQGEGSGIVLKYLDEPDHKILVKRSQDYVERIHQDALYEFSGWFTVNASDIDQYDTFVFVVFVDGMQYRFVLGQTAMKRLVSHKAVDVNNKYHFYFAKDFDDNYVEMRHDEVMLEPSMVYQTGDDYSWFVFENKKEA